MEQVSPGTPVEGQPQTPTDPQQGQAQQEPTPALSEEQVRAIATEIATRTAQSLVDKGTSRIEKLVAERIQALEVTRQSLGLTDEQVAAAKQKIVVDAITEEQKPPAVPASTAPKPASQTPLHPILEAAVEMMAQQGVSVDEGDPEFATIKADIESPAPSAKLLVSLQSAITAKAARLASQKERADARVPGASGTGSSGEGYDPTKPSSYYLENARRK
jgi:hypothetical protein